MRVVVYHILMLLPVALARCKDYGARILEHGYEIRNDNGLRVEVFCGAEETGALPFP